MQDHDRGSVPQWSSLQPGRGPARRPRRAAWRPLAVAAFALASLPAVGARGFDLVAEDWPGEATLGPGAVFESIETAAVDALAHARHHEGPADRGRLRIGTIRRVPGGFSYGLPERSRATVWSLAPPVLRFGLGPEDVATYVVHPRSGRAVIDRENEEPNPSERRLVDRLDPRGRPLYLLTPSQRVLRYERDREQTPVEQLVSTTASGPMGITLP